MLQAGETSVTAFVTELAISIGLGQRLQLVADREHTIAVALHHLVVGREGLGDLEDPRIDEARVDRAAPIRSCRWGPA